ncbi:MAG: hypothetical protein KBG39_03935 [Opitutaceae bacterium]|jgi:hypothetical protein|nr:hypothetical protein [Opitutaceae bacterium]MBP8962074.1 hypothetical protein [Opitutaceae bacterium]
MKSTARILSSLALAWLVLLGLHSSAWLLQILFPDCRWGLKLDELPLPPLSARAHWPVLLGSGGLLLALALSSHAERREKLRRERSEA